MNNPSFSSSSGAIPTVTANPVVTGGGSDNNNNDSSSRAFNSKRGSDGLMMEPNSNSNSGGEEGEIFVKGEIQPDEYRDVNFARLFYLQLAGVFVTAIYFIPAAFSSTTTSTTGTTDNSISNADDDGGFDTSSFVVVLGTIFVASFVTIMGFLTLMIQQSHRIVPVAFVASPALLVVVAVATAVGAGIDVAYHLLIWAGAYALVCACVYHFYKAYIPFAASTLHTALTAIEYNKGLLMLSGGFLVLNFSWVALIMTTLVGIMAHADAQGQVLCSEKGLTPEQGYPEGSICDEHPPNAFAIMMLIFSMYWTQQVIRNVNHCTTAGTIASWWFSPALGDPALCSQHTTDSLRRSLTFSFGSICFGSLLVAVMQTLESMARSARRNRRGALLACCLECILHFLRRWLEYMNSWAFVYVALYGYDYLTAGRNVMTLFKNRGWSSFIADRLVFRVLHSVNLAVGLVCGMVAALTDAMIGPVLLGGEGDANSSVNSQGMNSGYSNSNYDSNGNYNSNSNYYDNNEDDDIDMTVASHFFCFFLGLIIGLIFSGVAMFVVESAVRTVIVCFAESPGEFREHHPVLCEEMCQGWAQSYPESWEASALSQLPRATVIEQPNMYKDDHHLGDREMT